MNLSIEKYGSGEPLILIHGMGSAATAWKPIIPSLANSFEVYTVDLPGHGKSALDLSIAMDPKSLSDLVLANLIEQGIEKFHLVGNS